MSREELVHELKRIKEHLTSYNKILQKRKSKKDAYEMFEKPVKPSKDPIDRQPKRWHILTIVIAVALIATVFIVISQLGGNAPKSEQETYFIVEWIIVGVLFIPIVLVALNYKKLLKKREIEQDEIYDGKYKIYSKNMEQYQEDVQAEIKRIELRNNEIENEAEAYLKNSSGTLIDFPWKYANDIDRIIATIESFRADNVKEAINVLRDDDYKAKMLNSQRQLAAETRRHNLEMEEQHMRLIEETERHNSEMEMNQEIMQEDIRRQTRELEKLNRDK